ncbi:MAG: nicotinate-nucleotide adenylyltransferase [Rubripirellula sp.]|nr:nicotinate (nicotinamide) nucleotide adenylyltransferase [Planctomycetaceae bacterium]MDF1843220.1 nicotinate-nucleotide adenylyltransferase [Rubripirellula sp.]
MKKMGVFGGSFDPIHLGHLWIAEAAKEDLGLDEIRWIPAAQSPLKTNQPLASAEDRMAMIRLALSDCAGHVIDDREVRRGDVSYTVETLLELKDEYPDAEFWLLIGSDSLHSIPEWREPARLLQLAQLAVVQRGGDPELDFSVLEGLASNERLEQLQSDVIHTPVIELSSSEVRGRIAGDRSIRFRTPRAVEALIKDRKLYRD